MRHLRPESVEPSKPENLKPAQPAPRLRFSRRRYWLSLALGSFYAVIVLGIALLAGSFLYEFSRSYTLGQYQPDQITRLGLQGVMAQPSADVETPSSPAALTGSVNRAEPAQPPPQREISILLLGTDERADEVGPPRTDTIILLNVNLETRSAGLISLPRDLWVPIPGYDITTKINSAYALGERRGYPGGGAQLVKDTVGSFLGRPVEYYVQVNFVGFERLVDLIGGVDLYVPRTILDEHYPTPDYGYQTFYLEAGYQQLDGTTALKYVRTRNTDNDYMRSERQQQVIQAVMDKVFRADMIPLLISRAPQLTSAMRDSVSTDLPIPFAVELANYVRQQPIQSIHRLVLDNRYGVESYSEEGAWILLPDRSLIRPALGEFFNAIAQPNLTSQPLSTVLSAEPVQDPRSLRLEILNGTGYPGVAAQMRQDLEALGWQVVSIGDADRSDYRRTLLVNYNADNSLISLIGEDLQLATQLPTLTGFSPASNVDLRIVVGQDFLKDVRND